MIGKLGNFLGLKHEELRPIEKQQDEISKMTVDQVLAEPVKADELWDKLKKLKAENYKSGPRTKVMSDPAKLEVDSIDMVDPKQKSEEQICMEVIGDVNKVKKQFDILAGGNKNFKIVDEVEIPLGEDKKKLMIWGGSEYNEDGTLESFHGGTKLKRFHGDDGQNYRHVRYYPAERWFKITEETLKKLEGMMKTDELKTLLNKEFEPKQLELAIFQLELGNSLMKEAYNSMEGELGYFRQKELAKEVMKNAMPGDTRERYELSTHKTNYTVWKDKEGKMTLCTHEISTSIL